MPAAFSFYERIRTTRQAEDEAVKHHARPGRTSNSMNHWLEGLLDVGDLKRRCTAHDRWMQANPAAAAFSDEWADRNLEEPTRP
jgi:hypothetical protein